MIPKLRPFGRVKPKYNPQPNAGERAHEERLAQYPCIGCGTFARVELHHTLMNFPAKRWRRDHRYQLPVCSDCHRGPQGIHGIGSEAVWGRNRGIDTAALAQALWAETEQERAA